MYIVISTGVVERARCLQNFLVLFHTTGSKKHMASILQKFYEGRVVLLTGGTGFLGKVLLLKLLHSCPDIGAIILILRKKHGQSCQERLFDILSSSVGAKCLFFDPCEVFVFRSIGASQLLWLFQELRGKKTLQFASIMGWRNNWGYWNSECKPCIRKGKFLPNGSAGFTADFLANNETISVDRLHLSRKRVSSVGVVTSLWAWWRAVRTPQGERNFSFPWPLIQVLLYFPGGQLAEAWFDLSLPSSAQAKNERRCKIYSSYMSASGGQGKLCLRHTIIVPTKCTSFY
jgi:hypothetical protein